MRILQVSSEHPPIQVFGLGRYVCDLSRELVRQGHQVHVLTNYIDGTEQDVVDSGVSIHRVDFPPPPKPATLGGPPMAFNLLLQQRAHAVGFEGCGRPEVAVSHDWLTALASHRIAKRWGLPHVWTVHDTVYGKRFGRIEDAEDRLAFEIERWAAEAADLVLVNSRAIREEVISAYQGKPDRVELLHCGIDPDTYSSDQGPSRLAAFRQVLCDPGEVLVTYCGRLDLEKGIDTLINAFGILRGRGVQARLALAGRGSLRPTIEDHIRRLGLDPWVRLVGYLEGAVLVHFYRASDIHVCPSHYEPFGLVAAEAMAAGTPVVVSATGGLTDIVTGSDVGRAVPPRDIRALATTLHELAADPELRKRLGSAGQKYVRRNFSWRILAPRAASLYASAVRQKALVPV